MPTSSVAEERRELADARRRWGETASPETVAKWFAGNAEIEYLAGCFGAALKDAGYVRRVASDPTTVANALRVIGCVQLERGDHEAAIVSLRAAEARADLAFALADAGRVEESLAVDEPAVMRAWDTGRLARARLRAGLVPEAVGCEGVDRFGWTQIELANAETLLARGRCEAALQEAGVLVEKMRSAGVRGQLGDALLARIRALRRLGRSRDLLAAEQELRELALSLGSRRLLKLLV
jgi:hypothetical protein